MYEGPNIDKDSNLLPLELSGDLPDALRDSNVPAFMREDYRKDNYVDKLVSSVQEQLDKGKETYIRGEGNVYISGSQLSEMAAIVEQAAIVGRIKVKIEDMVNLPSPEDVARIFEEAYRKVDEDIPPDFKDEAREGLQKIEPKYANRLEEVADALNVELPKLPYE